MNRTLDWKQAAAALLKKAGGFDVAANDFVIPDEHRGDLAFPCFSLSKAANKSATDLALELAEAINQEAAIKDSIISRAEATGPYLNFFLNRDKAAKNIIDDIAASDQKYGSAKGKPEKILLEYVSPNTNKPLHVGHLRNAFIGWSLAKLLENQGAKVIKSQIINDRGIHIMKSLLAYMKWGNNSTPKTKNEKGDHFIGDFYVRFTSEAKKNPALEEEAQKLLKLWEEGDIKLQELLKKINQWVMAGQQTTIQRIGISFDRTDYEHDIYEAGKELVGRALTEGFLKKRADGAVVIDLSDKTAAGSRSSEKILLRSDGTSFYITQDLALAKKRLDEVRPDRLLYVVGQEQDYHFAVLFEVLERLKIADATRLSQVSYHWVFLPEGRMKSREGTVIDADNLLDELHELAAAEIKKRNSDLAESEMNRRAEAISLAAAKYYLLRVKPSSDIKFNPAESIAFNGDTGPYLLYTFARIKSIFRKAKIENYELTERLKKATVKTISDGEWSIIRLAAQFPDIAKKSAETLDPSLVAEFAYSFSRAINDFYETEHVLTSPEPLRTWRINLLAAASLVLISALELIGITPLEEM